MNTMQIRAFIDANRPVAEVQRQRWDGVDPTRLLEACDLLEQVLAEQTAATASPFGDRHAIVRPRLQIDGALLAVFDTTARPTRNELKLVFVLPSLLGPAGMNGILAMLHSLACSPVNLKIEEGG